MLLTQNDIFAVYRLPGSKHRVIINQNLKESIPFNKDSLNKSGFVFSPFSSDKHKPLFINADKIYIEKSFEFEVKNTDNTIDINQKKYLSKINFFIKEIKKGYRKIVLSRTKSIINNNIDLFNIFKGLEISYPNAMIFLVNHPESGTWMGATPEILLEKKENKAKTMALAGTQFVQNPSSASWGSKEQDEQKAVMDFIENILKKNNIPYSRKGPYTKTIAKNSDGYLIHLATDYQIEYIKNIYNIIMELHPTPAVSGLPKEKSIKFILENEAYDRKYYTGFLGPVNIEKQDTLKLFVNLRSMEIFKNKFLLYLGGGLNKNSIPVAEWEETENKAKTLTQVIEKSIYL